MYEWPCMRVGWGLLVLIRVVKGFVLELPNGEIMSVYLGWQFRTKFLCVL